MRRRNNEEPEITRNEKRAQQMFGDQWDVMRKATTVHSESIVHWLNEDFKMSDLNPRQALLAQRSITLLMHIIAYLDYTKHMDDTEIMIEDEKFIRKGMTKQEIEEVNKVAIKITTRIVSDLQAMALLSSAKGGKIINAIVQMIKQGTKETEETSLADQLKPAKKDEEPGI